MRRDAGPRFAEGEAARQRLRAGRRGPHFHEVTVATSLNAAIFGAPGGALQKQLVASFDSCLTAVGELKLEGLAQQRAGHRFSGLAAESRRTTRHGHAGDLIT